MRQPPGFHQGLSFASQFPPSGVLILQPSPQARGPRSPHLQVGLRVSRPLFEVFLSRVKVDFVPAQNLLSLQAAHPNSPHLSEPRKRWPSANKLAFALESPLLA